MKEPWIRVVKKAELGKRETLILRLEAIVLALVAGGFFILLIGQNPFVIYQTIVTGALRSEMAIQATVKIMIPLLIASLGVTLAFKMKFWNIGAEGQIIMGGIFASYFALFHANWNHWLLVIVAWLAQLNPPVILLVTFLFSVLEKGSSVVQSSFGLSSDCADVLQGIILFFILGCELFIRYQFVFRGKGGTRA